MLNGLAILGVELFEPADCARVCAIIGQELSGDCRRLRRIGPELVAGSMGVSDAETPSLDVAQSRRVRPCEQQRGGCHPPTPALEPLPHVRGEVAILLHRLWSP